MKITLPQKWINHLDSLPESGMGYHKVDVYFLDGTVEINCVVLNSELIELPQTCHWKVIKDILLS